MDTKRLEEILGKDVRIACERRGYDLRSFDWSRWSDPSHLQWFEASKGADDVRFLDVYLPLIARLLQSVVSNDREIRGESDAMSIVIDSKLTRAALKVPDSELVGQIELTALLASRASVLAAESRNPDPLDLMIDMNDIVFKCLSLLERFRASEKNS